MNIFLYRFTRRVERFCAINSDNIALGKFRGPLPGFFRFYLKFEIKGQLFDFLEIL